MKSSPGKFARHNRPHGYALVLTLVAIAAAAIAFQLAASDLLRSKQSLREESEAVKQRLLMESARRSFAADVYGELDGQSTTARFLALGGGRELHARFFNESACPLPLPLPVGDAYALQPPEEVTRTLQLTAKGETRAASLCGISSADLARRLGKVRDRNPLATSAELSSALPAFPTGIEWVDRPASVSVLVELVEADGRTSCWSFTRQNEVDENRRTRTWGSP
jgi:hypothetical protein